MRKLVFPAFALALIVGLGPCRAFGQMATSTADKTPPSYDMKAQALLDLKDLQNKYVSLAKAIPAEKYNWRPADGVRSIGEVYLHVAGTNFLYGPAIGATPVPGFKPDGFDKSTNDKAKIIDQLNQSFDYVRAAVEKMLNVDFKKPLKQFGPDANAGDIVYIIVVHGHEHLGQSIAYARMNGVVPPWTAARLNAQPQE